jgi:hypothetical protein
MVAKEKRFGIIAFDDGRSNFTLIRRERCRRHCLDGMRSDQAIYPPVFVPLATSIVPVMGSPTAAPGRLVVRQAPHPRRAALLH